MLFSSFLSKIQHLFKIVFTYLAIEMSFRDFFFLTKYIFTLTLLIFLSVFI